MSERDSRFPFRRLHRFFNRHDYATALVMGVGGAIPLTLLIALWPSYWAAIVGAILFWPSAFLTGLAAVGLEEADV